MSDNTDKPMSRSQLIEARAKISRQLEILHSPVGYGPAGTRLPPDNRQLIDELEQELAAVNALLAPTK